MATISELENALTKAHQAGDTKSASIFADQIRQQRSSGPTARGVEELSRLRHARRELGEGQREDHAARDRRRQEERDWLLEGRVAREDDPGHRRRQR